MNKSPFLFFLLLVFPISSAFSLFTSVEGVEDAHIKRVAVSSSFPELIYVGAEGALYKSEDAGKSFSKTHVFKDELLQHLSEYCHACL